ncbi:MAG: hypothetical protein OXH75_15545 [Acidobacteria bacterium]|nr:hypothetical protein [Acidobacteriota bacterium]
MANTVAWPDGGIEPGIERVPGAASRNTSSLWKRPEGSGLRPVDLLQAHADDDERGYIDPVWPWVPVQSSRMW